MKSQIMVLMSLIICSTITFAHPGRTASDGCHYCRTNCGSWGVPWNERHCHGRVKDDPVEKLMDAAVMPEETVVFLEHDQSNN